MSGHAILSASESHRWIACPGSFTLNKQVPRRPSAAATLGTAAHAAGYMILRGAELKSCDTFKFEDDGEIKEQVFDAKMAEAVWIYVRHVILLKKDLGGKVRLEKKVKVTPNVWGTGDCVQFAPSHLTVTDYKNGYTPVYIVDEEGKVNTQLLTYAVGALMDKECPNYGDDANVSLHIVQPNCMEVPAIQSVGITVGDVLDWRDSVLLPAEKEALSGKGKLVPGKHCNFCPSAPTCPALADKAQAIAVADFKQVASETNLPAVTALTDAQLSRILEWEPVFTGWLRQVQELAYERAMAGKPLPGTKLVQKRANRAWPEIDDLELAKRLKLLRPDAVKIPKSLRDQIYVSKLLSPKQMEEVVGKVVVDEVAEKPAGGLTLAKSSDKRPAVEPKGEDFKKFLEERSKEDLCSLDGLT